MPAIPSDPPRPFDLLVVGEVNADVIVVDADPRPVFGQAERVVRDIHMTIGSSSVITACAAARLGLRVSMVGVVGDDALGRFLLDAMRERTLDTSGVRIDPSDPTGASVILSDGRDRAILTALGTIGAVRRDDVTPEQLGRARHLHIGSWFLQRGLWADGVALLDAARSAGLTTSLDPNWDPDEGWDRGIHDLLPLLDLFFPNEAEVTRIAGTDDVADAAARLARTGALIVVKRGVDGGLAVDPDGRQVATAAYPVEPVDTTGAGDAFDAGFLAAWLDGRSVATALRMGAVCGALSTSAIGGVDGQPIMSEVDAALAGWTS